MLGTTWRGRLVVVGAVVAVFGVTGWLVSPRPVEAGTPVKITPTARRPPGIVTIINRRTPAKPSTTPTVKNPAPTPSSGPRTTVFASGLNFPYGMAKLSDGSLLVGTSDPSGGGSLFSSTGTLLRLADANGDGVADGAGTVLYRGLPGVLTGLARVDNLVFVTSTQAGAERITILRTGSRPTSNLAFVGIIRLGFPQGWEHTTYGLAARGGNGTYELYFNIGSQFNAVASTSQVPISGLISGVAQGDSIYRVTLATRRNSVVVSNLTQIAKGLRNAAGLTIHPATGDLYIAENGIDGLVNRDEPLSADELNVIKAANLGGEVEDFGFPTSYVAYRTGQVVGGGGVAPVVAFQPIPDPVNGSESEGPAQVAIGLGGTTAYVGFHGRFMYGGLVNEENPLVAIDLPSKTYTHFVSNDNANVGHLDGLLFAGDSLFAADLSASNNMASGSGVITQFRLK